MEWKEKIKLLDSQMGDIIISTLEKNIEELKNDGDIFLREQGEKIASYLVQLSKDEITLKQLNHYMEDIKEILIAYSLKLSVESKTKIVSIVKVLIDFLVLIIGRLLVKDE